MKKTRKGFTLVELLIVVAILGILSAAMMVATQSATPKAKANQIATDLKAIASGVAVYLADSADSKVSMDYFVKHSNDYLFGTKLANYKITASTDTKIWYASYVKESLDTEVLAQMGRISADAGLESGVTPKLRVK